MKIRIRTNKNNPDYIYQPGDHVRYQGQYYEVDSNHMGFPWPVSEDGYFMGVVVIYPRPFTSIFLDARNGNELTERELNDRLNNERYDYNRRARDNYGRRYRVPTVGDLFNADLTRMPSVLRAMKEG